MDKKQGKERMKESTKERNYERKKRITKERNKNAITERIMTMK